MSGSILFSAIAALLSLPAYSAGPGTSAATFLNLGFGARPLALGESFVAVADDAAALHYNPAGLGFGPGLASRQSPRRYEMLASHALHIQDIRLSCSSRALGLQRHAPRLGRHQAHRENRRPRALRRLRPDGRGQLPEAPDGPGAGLGRHDRYIKQSIGERSASAYAVDLGALYRLRSAPVSLGASLVNLGTQVRFVEQGYPLPLTFRLGAAYGMTAKFPHALTAQIDLPRDNSPNLRLGLEYLGFGPFALRAGYRNLAAQRRRLGKALGSARRLAEFYSMFRRGLPIQVRQHGPHLLP